MKHTSQTQSIQLVRQQQLQLIVARRSCTVVVRVVWRSRSLPHALLRCLVALLERQLWGCITHCSEFCVFFDVHRFQFWFDNFANLMFIGFWFHKKFRCVLFIVETIII